MTEPHEFLDDDQVERLGELLDLHAVPQQGLNMEALDGFLSALAVTPDAVPPEEWQPVVWGDKPPRWAGDAEREEAQALLSGHWATCLARARHVGDELPEALSPLLWLPEDPDAAQPDELDVGKDWAHGFFAGVELRSDAWQAQLDDNDWIDEIFALLEQLATGQNEDADGAAVPVSYRERMEIVASLPGMLADLYQQRLAASN